jgi:cytidylate kinase
MTRREGQKDKSRYENLNISINIADLNLVIIILNVSELNIIKEAQTIRLDLKSKVIHMLFERER